MRQVSCELSYIRIPTGHSAGNPPHAAAAVNRQDRQTGGWTLDHYIDPALHAMWAMPINIIITTCIRNCFSGHFRNISRTASRFQYDSKETYGFIINNIITGKLAFSYHDYYTHTHKNPFNGPFLGLPRWAGTRKVKPIWILLKQETMSGSGISLAICKSAPRSRQITTPAPHHSVFTGRMPFLPTNQQRQSIKGTYHDH